MLSLHVRVASFFPAPKQKGAKKKQGATTKKGRGKTAPLIYTRAIRMPNEGSILGHHTARIYFEISDGSTPLYVRAVRTRGTTKLLSLRVQVPLQSGLQVNAWGVNFRMALGELLYFLCWHVGSRAPWGKKEWHEWSDSALVS